MIVIVSQQLKQLDELKIENEKQAEVYTCTTALILCMYHYVDVLYDHGSGLPGAQEQKLFP